MSALAAVARMWTLSICRLELVAIRTIKSRDMLAVAVT